MPLTPDQARDLASGIVDRANSDPNFPAQLRDDPSGALAAAGLPAAGPDEIESAMSEHQDVNGYFLSLLFSCSGLCGSSGSGAGPAYTRDTVTATCRGCGCATSLL